VIPLGFVLVRRRAESFCRSAKRSRQALRRRLDPSKGRGYESFAGGENLCIEDSSSQRPNHANSQGTRWQAASPRPLGRTRPSRPGQSARSVSFATERREPLCRGFEFATTQPRELPSDRKPEASCRRRHSSGVGEASELPLARISSRQKFAAGKLPSDRKPKASRRRRHSSSVMDSGSGGSPSPSTPQSPVR